ncbi:MAG: hypothetical protein DRI39_05545 [Chloroflexi bacterium]|nr:MAG: hypothetical protein DRI39_05545 [Chloroflexota bacterium]
MADLITAARYSLGSVLGSKLEANGETREKTGRRGNRLQQLTDPSATAAIADLLPWRRHQHDRTAAIQETRYSPTSLASPFRGGLANE